MGVNKVEFGGKKLIDLTGDTVTPEVLKKGYTAHNSAGELVDGNFKIKNQSKRVSPLISAQKVVVPDDGYDGLSQVIVNPINLQNITINSFVSTDNSGDILGITPDDGYDGFSEVFIQGIEGQNKSVNPTTSVQTIKPDSGKTLSQVTVNAINNQAKSVTLSTSSQTIKPDSGYDGLSQVTVPAVALQEKTVYPSTYAYTVTPDTGKNGLSKVTVNAATLQAKTVDPSTSAQTIKPDSGQYGLSQVTVNAAKLQNKSITPTSSVQTIYPDSGFYGLGAVSVAAIPNLSTGEKLGNTNGLTIIPDGYSVYCFMCIGINDGKGAPYYGTVESKGYINRFEHTYAASSALTVYLRVTIFDSSIGGTAPITKNARMYCYGFK